MAWTAPRTWVTSEVVSAAIMNTHVRDNLLALAATDATLATAATSKYKTADESVNNSTTLQNDDHLAWALAANEVWAFSAFLYFTVASGNPGVRWAFTVPASCTGWYITYGLADNVDGGGNNGSNDVIWSRAIATAMTTWAQTGLTSFLAHLRGVVTNGANAGTVQFQWAQQTAVASNLTLKLGSYIDLKRLA